VWGFTGPWDPRSAVALRRAAPHLDVAVTGWIALDSTDGSARARFSDNTRHDRRFPSHRFALVTAWMGSRFHPETIRRLANDEQRRTAMAREVARLVERERYRGVVLDFEELAAEDSSALAMVTEAVAAPLRASGVLVALAVPAIEAPAYRTTRVLAAVDRVVVMLYDEHWAGSAPGPVATPSWLEARLADWLAVLPAERLVAALPTYGYFWRNAAPGEVLSHGELVTLSAQAGVPVERDSATGAAHLTLPEVGEAWFSDAAALDRLISLAKRHGVAAIALWRLGLDDPSLWPERR
jgi:spore germination protein YaaH